MGEWRRYDVSTLIDDGVLRIGDGYRARNEELAPSGIPFARVGNVSDGFRFDDADHFPMQRIPSFGNKVSQPGDVVFTSKGTVGRFAFVRPDTPRFVYSPQLCFWRSTDVDLIDSRFLYYWIQSREFFVQFKGVAGQTDMAEYVSLSDQRRMHITLPPLPEQRAIAQILGTLDDKIELNRRMNETLEAMARALFKSWFVDFDPVRAKMEGRWRRGESLPGLPAHLYDLFPDRLVDSELGEIPEGWEVGTLERFADLNPEVWSNSTRPEEIRYVDLSSVKWGRMDSYTTYSCWEAPSRAQRVIRPWDSIVGTVRPGNGSYAMVLEVGLTGSTGFAVLRPKRRDFAALVYLAATEDGRIVELARLADGGAYPAVRPEAVVARPISYPRNALVAFFQRHAGPLLELMAFREQESRILAALRDTLLPKLIVGEHRVENDERLAMWTEA
jgi:type I restriction enzyme, S subunit